MLLLDHHFCLQIRASKGEDEVDELMTKARQLETELDLTTEKLAIATLQVSTLDDTKH